MEVRGTMLLRNTADDKIWVLQTERLEQVRPQQGRQPSRKHRRQHADSHLLRLAASLASAAAATAAAAADLRSQATAYRVSCVASGVMTAAASAQQRPPACSCCRNLWHVAVGPAALTPASSLACLLSVSLCVCVCVQIDLSDDYLVFMLFADNGWEEQLLPIQIADESGEASTLEMGEQQFKDYVGLIKTLQEAEQEAQEALGGQEEDDGPIDVTAEVAPSNGNKQ